jgi:hypothetical protein
LSWRGIDAIIAAHITEDRTYEFCHFESIISVFIMAGVISGDFLL